MKPAQTMDRTEGEFTPNVDRGTLTIAAIIHAITGARPDGYLDAISDAVIDSRLANPGSLFVAIQGENTDGHDHLAEAFELGATLALIDRDVDPAFRVVDLTDVEAVDPPLCLRVENTVEALQAVAKFWREQLDLRVIGITGSVGKSTTKELVSEVLQQRFRTHKNEGNLNNEIGLPLSLLKITSEDERAVLEMGFYVPGEIALLGDIAKD